ncbi:galactokinase [Geosmithia morbida]|uniref:Galactokinase n=1 Tax=Geosmithia morbida TaxID=1094350 RepID=A0A9P4YV57_9HYPO|nr:galactokinase [Geosmithia morbida]KAF4122291.1 galactokinase [Geosmithia morbida]
MSSAIVPHADALSDIYPPSALATQGPRWNALVSKFTSEFGRAPTFISRSPGRVNIIGEHIDYSLYACLPMAITADALLAVSASAAASPDGFRVRIRNVQGDKFPPNEFTVPFGGDVDIDSTIFEWTNYFKSGLLGALGPLRRRKGAGYEPVDMDIVMDGNVPVGGGLSSSAAFTTASALAVMVANGETDIDKKELTELAIVSERAVGVNSGGLDQAASVLSQQGSALFVSFTPRLDARPVKFPPTRPELCFLIAQSFVTSNKRVTGPVQYNLRVVECSFAAAYLNAVLCGGGGNAASPLEADAGPLGISLQGFHQAYFARQRGADTGAPRSLRKEDELERLIELTESTLTQEDGYTMEEVASKLGTTTTELEKRFTSRCPVRAERFKLRQRALHVFSEALRVLRFLSLLESPLHTGATDTSVFAHSLGDLMNQTQDSCRDLYECSCPELDDICRIARDAGAYGSRLTGAGWGGCSVHLVPADRVDDVQKALQRDYYAKRELTDEQKGQAIVVSRPGSGSAIYTVGKDV